MGKLSALVKKNIPLLKEFIVKDRCGHICDTCPFHHKDEESQFDWIQSDGNIQRGRTHCHLYHAYFLTYGAVTRKDNLSRNNIIPNISERLLKLHELVK